MNFSAKHEPRYKYFSSQMTFMNCLKNPPECLLQLNTSWKGASFPNVCNAILYIIWFYDWTQNIDKTITSPRSEQLWNDTFLRMGIWLFLLSACSSNAILCSLILWLLWKWRWQNENFYVDSPILKFIIPPIAQSTLNVQYLTVVFNTAHYSQIITFFSKAHNQTIFQYTWAWPSIEPAMLLNFTLSSLPPAFTCWFPA